MADLGERKSRRKAELAERKRRLREDPFRSQRERARFLRQRLSDDPREVSHQRKQRLESLISSRARASPRAKSVQDFALSQLLRGVRSKASKTSERGRYKYLFSVQEKHVPGLIGVDGEITSFIESHSGATIVVRDAVPGEDSRVFEIVGKHRQIAEAYDFLLHALSVVRSVDDEDSTDDEDEDDEEQDCIDFHWRVYVKLQEGDLNREDGYIKILAKVVGSEEAAKSKLYTTFEVGGGKYYGFGALITKKQAEELIGMPGVSFVAADASAMRGEPSAKHGSDK